MLRIKEPEPTVYCHKCRVKVVVQNPIKVMPGESPQDHRTLLKGSCPVCHSKIAGFIRVRYW